MAKKAVRHPLTICFDLLRTMGKSGELIWENSTHIVEVSRRLQYLQYAIAFAREKRLENSRKYIWREFPLDFWTFVESEKLLKKRGALWAAVIDEGCAMNSGKYTEVVLTGGIGCAKTTLALYSQAYQVYVLSCLAEPHKMFDLDEASEILIVFQSISKHLAQDVDYTRFRNMIVEAPYFNEYYPFDTSLESVIKFPRNVTVKPISGSDTGAIGQNVIGGIIDEVNFMAIVENSKNSRDGGVHDQAVKNYNSIASRRESRFMQVGGSLPGLLCLVSSRNYPGQFTDKKEEEARRHIEEQGFSTIYIYDKRIWDIRPERFTLGWFDIFIGDDTRKPRILQEGDVVAAEDQHLVLAVPNEYRNTFNRDLLSALREVAGVATLALHPFMINTDAVAEAFGKCEHILSREACDFLTTKVSVYPNRIVNPHEPRFVHIDLALSRDSAGVVMGHVPSFKTMDRGDYLEAAPVIQYDMILEVLPPRGGEIEFDNIRRLLYTLRDKLGIPIKWVTFDQFQSKDGMQILSRQGFMVGYQSMDTSMDAYEVMKSAFYDKRVNAPHNPKAQKEIVTLEIDTKKRKIDHPPQGSKDVADAMAGVAIGLTNRRELWVRHKVPTRLRPNLKTERPQAKNSIEGRQRRGYFDTEEVNAQV